MTLRDLMDFGYGYFLLMGRMQSCIWPKHICKYLSTALLTIYAKSIQAFTLYSCVPTD